MSASESIYVKRSLALAAVSRVQALVEVTKDDAFLSQMFQSARDTAMSSDQIGGRAQSPVKATDAYHTDSGRLMTSHKAGNTSLN